MKNIIVSKALLLSGWADNVCLQIDDNGLIQDITENYMGEGVRIEGYALPGMNNVHSHAFQRAMAGLAEYSTSAQDSFWTWRDLMYRFAGQITADDLEIIAAQLYLEMLKAGYVSVTEFHYLHGRKDGKSGLEMSQAIMGAANKLGIGLCHLPVLYMASGFGAQPVSEKQLSFSHNLNEYIDLLKTLSRYFEENSNQHLGIAFHSLRAVPEEALKECLTRNPTSGPIHIHISEQIQEVDDCLTWSGKRPVEWLYDNVDVDDRWCLIHATHLKKSEILTVAKSGAVVGLCPTTEANLGDGLFPLQTYMEFNGDIAIGSDSHISISVIEEIRLLEYGQRLQYRQRNVAVDEKDIHTGSNLYHKNLRGGAKASGFDNGEFAIGKRADLIILDPTSPLLVGTPDRSLIDRFIFSGNVNPIRHAMVAGEMVIQDGKHEHEDEILTDFSATMKRLEKTLD